MPVSCPNPALRLPSVTARSALKLQHHSHVGGLVAYGLFPHITWKRREEHVTGHGFCLCEPCITLLECDGHLETCPRERIPQRISTPWAPPTGASGSRTLGGRVRLRDG